MACQAVGPVECFFLFEEEGLNELRVDRLIHRVLLGKKPVTGTHGGRKVPPVGTQDPVNICGKDSVTVAVVFAGRYIDSGIGMFNMGAFQGADL